MNERELLERLAVLLLANEKSKHFIREVVTSKLDDEIWMEAIDVLHELREYLPAQPSPDAPVQLELREDA